MSPTPGGMSGDWFRRRPARLDVTALPAIDPETAAKLHAARDRMLEQLGEIEAERAVAIEAWLARTMSDAGLTLADAPRCLLVTEQRERAPSRWVDVLTLEVDAPPGGRGRRIGESFELTTTFITETP